MKVGLVTTGFPRFEGDHSGSFLLTFARGLVAHGYGVRVLAPEPRQTREVPRWSGIEVSWIPYLRPRDLQQTFYGSGAPDNLRLQPARWAGAASFTAALGLGARRRLEDCDVLVSSWCIPSGWVASSVASGRTHLCICHATDLRWLRHTPGRGPIARRIVRGATSMWFLSAALRQAFFDTARLPVDTSATHLGPMPIEIPQSLSTERSELRRRLGIEGFTVLVLGRLVPVKGLVDLLWSVASISEPVSIRIAGDGPDRGALEALSSRLGLDVTFEGWVAGRRKEALLRACDAMVVPSRHTDGLPTVLFEARARSLPIVATDIGVISDALKGSPDVLLVPPGDRAALGRALRALRAERLGSHGLRA